MDDATEQLKEFIGSHRIKRRVVDTTEQVNESVVEGHRTSKSRVAEYTEQIKREL